MIDKCVIHAPHYCIIWRLLFFCVLCFLSLDVKSAHSGMCYLAKDFGLGGNLEINANPDKNNSTQNSTLIRKIPRNSQIAPWVDSGLYTLGNPNDPRNPEAGILKITVNGKWYPWGQTTEGKEEECKLKECDANDPEGGLCWIDGKTVDKGPQNSNIPCFLSKGWGLYGLIALGNPNRSHTGYNNPNELSASISLPTDWFRTFSVAHGKMTQVGDSYVYSIDATKLCNELGCNPDIHPDGGEYVRRGKLFFKIADQYYEDNTGGYSLNITNGVTTPQGFIEEIVYMFESQIQKVTKSLYQGLVKDAKLITIVRTVLVLYVAINGLLFMLGLIRTHQRELIVTLFKFAVVATVISEQSWDFFNSYLFSWVSQLSRDVGSMIVQATLRYDGSPHSTIFYIPENASPLAIYDVLLKIFINTPLHAKILSLLFYDWKLYWIPCIYVCIYFMLKAMLKSVMLYLLMVLQFAFLLLVAPIFIIMMLFKITNQLFDNWLKQIIGSGILYILITISIGMMMQLIFGQVEALLAFKVCWDLIWSFKILDLTILEINFWYPQSATEVLDAVSVINFISFLLISFIFFGLLESIPQIVDMLIGSQRGALSKMYGSGFANYQNSVLHQAITKTNDAVYKGAMAAVTYIDGGVTAKTLGGVGIAASQLRKVGTVLDHQLSGDGKYEAFDIQHDWIGKPSVERYRDTNHGENEHGQPATTHTEAQDKSTK